MPLRVDYFHCGEVYGLRPVYCHIEDTAIYISPEQLLHPLRFDADLHPVMMATKKSMPARFPRKETTQLMRTSITLIRRWRRAVVINWNN